MKITGIKSLCICLLLSFSMLLGAVSFAAGATPTANSQYSSTTTSSVYGIDAKSTLLGNAKQIENIRSAFLYEANSSTLMYAWNEDVSMYPASLVKIMTALIAIEKGKLNDTVTVTQSAISSVPHDAVSVKLQADEQLTLEQLLYCIIVGSANDAAAAVAEHISVTQNAFVEEMNQYANKLACTGTKFMNVHGLHDEQQRTTARDVARILDVALHNEVFYRIFTTTKYRVEATNKSEVRDLVTSNTMKDATSKLYYDARVQGGRTGVSEDGRRCLATVSENNGMRLICVVMGSESVYLEDGLSAVSIGGFKETTALLDMGFTGHKTAQILYANQALRQYKVAEGDCDVVAGPQISVSTVLPVDTVVSNLTFQYLDTSLSAPVSYGQKVSRVQIWNGNVCVAEADLIAMNAVQHVNTVKQSMNVAPIENNNWGQVLLTVLTVLVIILLVLVFTRYSAKLRILSAKKRSMRYRRSRRRSR